ncbi:MAG: transposase [Planctomycetaceae bacterium]|nr:transposase [Planctomycetaceae bacterium]
MATHAVKNYPTDLTDAQWELIRSFIVLPTGGRPKTTDLRSIMNAILYQIKTGCQWLCCLVICRLKEQSVIIFIDLNAIRY